jgi:hypothetical protein
MVKLRLAVCWGGGDCGLAGCGTRGFEPEARLREGDVSALRRGRKRKAAAIVFLLIVLLLLLLAAAVAAVEASGPSLQSANEQKHVQREISRTLSP